MAVHVHREGAARAVAGRAWHAHADVPVFGALAVVALARLVVSGQSTLAADEAYYWEWSRHLDAGYFDHPPLVALMIRATTALAGTTEFAVRLGPVVMAVGVAALVYRTGLLLGGRLAGWLCLVGVATCPLLVDLTTLATPDAPLLFFWAATVYAVLLAVTTLQARYWYGAGVLLGCALLAKEMAILLVPSILLCLLLAARGWLRRPEPYCATGLALLVAGPYLWWTLRTGGRYLSWQLAHGAQKAAATSADPLRAMALYALGQIAMVGPLLALLLGTATLVVLRRGVRQRHEYVLLACCTLVIALFFLLLRGLPHWAAPAYVSAIIYTSCLLVSYLRCAPRRRRALLAAVIALALLSNLAESVWTLRLIDVQASRPAIAAAIEPVLVKPEFAWRDVGHRLGAVLLSLPPAQRARVVLFADRYETAAEVAFYTPGHPRVYTASHQYALWGRPAALQGPVLFIGNLKQLGATANWPLRRGERILAEFRVGAGRGTRHLAIAELGVPAAAPTVAALMSVTSVPAWRLGWWH